MIRAMKTSPGREDTHVGIERKNSENEVMKSIEDNLRKLAEGCAENGLPFLAKQDGVKYCCLFMHGSNHTHLCPYVEEETIHISEKGEDTMRYKCRYDV